jgi:GTP-binding protein Era
VLEIEVIGIDEIADGERAAAFVLPTAAELERLCALAIASAGIEDGHVAIEFVDAERMRELNREHRQIDEPTDVLSFSVDGDGASAGPRELGDIALAGRPNVGKSTLANAIVGAKVAIVSDKPQTTRRAIRGVATGPDWQLVLVDLPGVQRPRDALTSRMQKRVEHELEDADACLFVVNAQEGVGPGDRFIATLLEPVSIPVVIAVNKVDRADRAATAAALQASAELDVADEVFPVSARTGSGITPMVDQLVSLLPHGPFYFEPQQRTDQPEHVRLAELVREQILRRTRQELPHSIEVVVEAIDPGEPTRIEAVILSETESQKRILIGAGGQMVKSIGIAARRAIEGELGARVHLDLRVRVRRHWRADEHILDRLGIE